MERIINYQNLYDKLKLKYYLERFLAYLALFILFPLILLGVLAIKINGWFDSKDKGPVFYCEPRFSAGKTFKIIKFRTVTTDAIKWIKEAPGERSITASSPQTLSGKVILNWYLDEIPQLLNIIKGEMSLVGPRPHIYRQHCKEIESGLIYRNFIKAGFFGVPQACKRHPKYRKMMENMAKTHHPNIELLNSLDGLYVKKCLVLPVWKIILFDFWVVARCIITILRGGAKF